MRVESIAASSRRDRVVAKGEPRDATRDAGVERFDRLIPWRVEVYDDADDDDARRGVDEDARAGARAR